MPVSSGTTNLNVPASAVAGSASFCGEMGDKNVAIEGAFTGTYQVQLSCDPANPPTANSWINEGAALTAPGSLYIQKPAQWVRLNCTAFTSAPSGARICGILIY
jgi:hypothetical protein